MTYTKNPQDRQEGVDGLGNPSPQSPAPLGITLEHLATNPRFVLPPEFTGVQEVLMHLRALGVRFWINTDGSIGDWRELSPTGLTKLMSGGAS